MTAVHSKPRTEITRMPARLSRSIENTLGTAGILAAAVGAWMYYAPVDWFLGGLAEGWYLGMFIAAGVLLAVAFGMFAWMSHGDDPVLTTPVVLTGLIALLALGGAITFAVFLII